jgi:hypothetical protein
MASSLSMSNNEFIQKYETWLNEKLKSKVNDPDLDINVFSNYILSTLSDDESSIEEKSDAIRPFLQELNQVCQLGSAVNNRIPPSQASFYFN